MENCTSQSPNNGIGWNTRIRSCGYKADWGFLFLLKTQLFKLMQQPRGILKAWRCLCIPPGAPDPGGSEELSPTPHPLSLRGVQFQGTEQKHSKFTLLLRAVRVPDTALTFELPGHEELSNQALTFQYYFEWLQKEISECVD